MLIFGSESVSTPLEIKWFTVWLHSFHYQWEKKTSFDMTYVKLDKFHTNKKGVNLNEETLYDFFMLQNQETYMPCFTFQFSMW